MYSILLFWNYTVILRNVNKIENKRPNYLQSSLNKAHNTAVGPNDIHYQLLKHLPDYCLKVLLDQWFLTVLEVLNLQASSVHSPNPFVIGKIKYDFFKT